MIYRGAMSRIVVIASVLLVGCDVGSVLSHNGGPDGGGGGDSGGSGGSNCQTLVSPPPTDHHNAGMGCMTAAGCHNAGLGLGAGAPEYSFAGTVYRDAAGTTPYAGATILVTAGGMTKKLIAGDQGNFQITPILLAAPTNTATANTKGSACPSETAMSGALVGGGGNCNGGGTCHGGTQGKIHVP
jgi:hypothetical protein